MTQFRHVYLERDSDREYPIDAFIVNQDFASVVAKFKTAWSDKRHVLEPSYKHVEWAHDAEVSEGELEALAARAVEHAPSGGHVLVVHARGRIGFLWSDHPVPRIVGEDLQEKFGAPLKGFPNDQITDGEPPPWWPR